MNATRHWRTAMNESRWTVTCDGNIPAQLARMLMYLQAQETGTVMQIEITHVHAVESAVKPTLPAHQVGGHE